MIGVYDYFIWANDTSDNTDITSVYSFEILLNNPPNQPTNPLPQNGSTGVATNPTLSVYVSDPDGDMMDVRFYNAANDGLIGIDSDVPNGSTASVTWSGLNYVTTYGWYTIAGDLFSENRSETWSFKTESDGGGGKSYYPPTADANGPYYGSPDEEIELDGSNSSDPNGNITGYRWDFTNDSVYDTDWLTTPTTTHNYIATGTYIVKLQVKNNANMTANDTATVFILELNNPPTKPTVHGNKTGHKNVNYTYTAISTDPDNDTIRYIFNWGDGTPNTVTAFVGNNTLVNTSHNWSAPAVYILKVYAEDDNNTVSGNAEIMVFIDVNVIFIDDVIDGYLIDYNLNGTYDVFHNNETGNETKVEQQDDGNYSIDSDGDNFWDYIYDPETDTLTEYSKGETTEKGDNIVWYALFIGMILAILLLLIIFLVTKKKKP